MNNKKKCYKYKKVIFPFFNIPKKKLIKNN